ncbi:hypothetical protein [Mycolicibacterium frederiksbergense]|nr:hypothetical protein [Mycolicibacterium frederiksbergense]
MSEPRRAENDPQLVALLRWREELIESGVVSGSAFKEAHIRLVLRSGRTEADQIGAMLPREVAAYAAQMAEVLASSAPVSEEGRCLPAGGSEAVPRSGFAPYRFAPSDREVLPLSARWAPDGSGVEVAWPPYRDDSAPRHADRYVIYRLVSTEGQHGPSPDSAYLVASTATPAARDDRPLVGAVRHLQVWVNAGESATDALAAQPFLHATGVVIADPQDVDIRDDFGRVVGQWTVLPGVRAVHIYRVPAELAERDGPQFRILSAQDNLGGFVDDAATRGRRYVYRVRCEIDVDGVARLSDAVQTEVTVTAHPEPVTDISLTTHRHGVDMVFDLEWTPPPFGRVLVFRTSMPPGADAATMELDQSVLEQVGLGREFQLIHPVSERIDEHGVRKSVLAAVPWPTAWTRAYFTPVTVVGGRARLGRAVSSVRTGVIVDAQISEYCEKQTLTFGWPVGAAAVLVYIAPKGYDPADGLSGRSYEIALAEYEKRGGVEFTGELPGLGCSLHLVPVAYAGGHRVTGVITTIEYPGLLRLWYDIELTRDREGRPLTAAVRVRAEDEVIGSPPFVLVYHPDRIPLAVRDGRAIDMTCLDAEGNPVSEPVKEFQVVLNSSDADDVWTGDVRGKTGWIKLFAHLHPTRLRSLALLDPPVAALRLIPEPEPK